MTRQITELVEFGIKDGVLEDEFFLSAKDLISFYANLEDSGYLSSSIVKSEDGLWIMIIDWISRDHEKKSSNLMMKDSSTERFRKSLDLSRFNKRIFTKIYVS